MTEDAERPLVVIIGGGFAGLSAARALAKARCRVLLMDRRNHHLFQPLLYQVATAVLNPADIAQPIRSILRKQRNCEVLLAQVHGIDRERQVVQLSTHEVHYDYLVVAAGAHTSFYGHHEWAAVAPGLKTVEDALDVRRRILLAYERAERDPDPDETRAWLNFVVVGGGPTGVELAGALSEIARTAMDQDFRHIDPRGARVTLVEGGERVLSMMAEPLSAAAERHLRELGVEVITGKRVQGIDADGVDLGDSRLEARTVLWAAGVQASPLGRSLSDHTTRDGRVPVGADLRLEGDERVFVVGDLAAATYDGKPVPGVAPAAMQAGRHAGRQIASMLRGEAVEPFEYQDKGDLATVGRARAVADLRWKRFTGRTAWWLWLVVHIAYLINFRSKLFVFLNWTWSYLSFRRGSRLITGTHRLPIDELRDEAFDEDDQQARNQAIS